MVNTVSTHVEELLKESLIELESSKGSVLMGVQKLRRAANLLGEDDISIWCEIQLGTSKYTYPLSKAATIGAAEHMSLDRHIKEFLAELEKTPKKKPVAKKAAKKRSATKGPASDWEKTTEESLKVLAELNELGLKEEIHYPAEERHIKYEKSSGGYQNIGTIEDIYASLLKEKRGNDGTLSGKSE